MDAILTSRHHCRDAFHTLRRPPAKARSESSTSRLTCGRCARWQSLKVQRAKQPRTRNPSLRRDAGRSNYFTPFRALLGDEGSKLGWCVRLRHDAKRHEALGGFRPFKIRRQRGVELIGDRLRRAGTGEKALPATGIVARYRFAKRRHAG